MPDPSPARLVVLASGTGTLLQALLDAGADRDYPATVIGVVSDRPGIEVLDRAARAGVTTAVVTLTDFTDRQEWDAALTAQVAQFAPDLVVLAGFMKLLDPGFLARFPGRVVNTHPALLPAFPGAHAVRDALAAGVATTGASVICVDEGVDTGPVLAQVEVPVLAGDDETRLHERIKVVERELLVRVVRDCVGSGGIDLAERSA